MRALALAAACAAALLATSPAHAQVSLLGDKDCFGLGGSCPDGTRWRDDLGGSFFTDYSTPGDPPFTDRWFDDANLAYTHAYVLGGAPTSASLTVKTAGLADNRGPWDVFFNGVLIGQFPTQSGPDDFQRVITHVFAVPVGLLTGSDDVLLAINTPTQTDGYSIDYSELTVNAGAVVPEPGTWVLLATGLAGVGAVARRRRRA